MRNLSLALVVLLHFACIACGEETGKTDDASAASQSRPQFLVSISEYHLKQPVPANATESDILEMLRRSKATPVETVRITATEDTESMANFGQRVTMTTGKVTRGPVTSRQTESLQIGTILRVRIVSHGDGAMADIDYSTSRLNGEGTDDSPPDVLSNTMQATQVYALGKQRLLSTSSVGNAPCVVVTILPMP